MSSIVDGTGDASVAIILVAPTVATSVRTVSLHPAPLNGPKIDGMVLLLTLVPVAVPKAMFGVLLVTDDCFCEEPVNVRIDPEE